MVWDTKEQVCLKSINKLLNNLDMENSGLTIFLNLMKMKLSQLNKDIRCQKEQSSVNLIKSNSIWSIIWKRDINCSAWVPSQKFLSGTKKHQRSNWSRSSREVISGQLTRILSQINFSSSTSLLFTTKMINSFNTKEVSIESAILSYSRTCLPKIHRENLTCWPITDSIRVNLQEKSLRNASLITFGRSLPQHSQFRTPWSFKVLQWL